MSLPEYGSIEAAIRISEELFRGQVTVQEKIDGSQVSFGIIHSGELVCRSKRQIIDLNAPQDLFKGVVTHAQSIKDQLRPGTIYRGEAIQRLRHNKLAYERLPIGNVVIFDIEQDRKFLNPKEQQDECARLGLEYVRVFFEGPGTNVTEEFVSKCLEQASFLGKALIEGVVIKNYGKDGSVKDTLIGKIVSESFKETKTKIKKRGEFLDIMLTTYKTDARWDKAIQHLRDSGKLTYTKGDLKHLIPELMHDIIREEGDVIKEKLWKDFWKAFSRELLKGFPEYYEQWLSENKLPSQNEAD